MKSHKNASRITDVVPANFLCDNQTMQKIAESQASDEQALSLLEANLSGLESRQQRLKDELASVERLISEAVTEQTRLRSSIETHKSLLAHTPVRALPGEVLSEIFLDYIALSQTRRGTVFQEFIASHRTRARILQVCRRWRTTALADPRLWTSIPLIGSGKDLHDDEEDEEDEEGSRDEEDSHDKAEKSVAHPMISGSPRKRAAYWKALENNLKRTASLPLQLLFHFDERGSISNRKDTVSSLQTFLCMFPRANAIALHIVTLKDLIPEFISVMDYADIPRADHVHTARIKVFHNAFGRKLLAAIPDVEVLEVDTWNIDQWFVDVPTAGHRLRSFHLGRFSRPISLAALLDLLDRAPLLETLKVVGISTKNSVGRNLTHKLLSTLHLSQRVTQEENDVIFGCLTLPALRSLSFEGSNYSWPRPSNMTFLQLSGCSLTEFSFRRCVVDELERLVALLAAHDKLTTLQLNLYGDGTGSGAPIPMSILEFLTVKPKDASSRPLPALTVLGVSILPRQLKAVKRLIESRFAAKAKKCGIATLREVGIAVQTKQSEEDIKKDEHMALFKAFMQKGMIIRISYR